MNLIKISGTIVISFRIFFLHFFFRSKIRNISNSNPILCIVSNLLKISKIIIASIENFFSLLRYEKTLTFKKFFPSLRSKIRKISNLVLFFYISSNILKISKIIIIPVQKNCFHQRFNKMTLPFIRFSYLSFHREKTIHSLVETYSLSNLFRFPVDSH